MFVVLSGLAETALSVYSCWHSTLEAAAVGLGVRGQPGEWESWPKQTKTKTRPNAWAATGSRVCRGTKAFQAAGGKRVKFCSLRWDLKSYVMC